MRFEYYHQGGLLSAGSGQQGWRWRFVASNGKIISSGEAYANKSDCLHAIQLLQQADLRTPVVETTS